MGSGDYSHGVENGKIYGHNQCRSDILKKLEEK
jgi:hypothetical protein